MTKEQQNVVRFAPSPTGPLHIGSVRTALFNFLYARKNSAKFILRLEDTDTERSKREFEEDILSGFEWLGIYYDELYKQSERTEIYQEYIKKLIDSGCAYVSEEPSGERQSVIRFKNPNKSIRFEDIIRGEVSFDTTELGDFVIAKSENEPLYNLAVVVDDKEMGVTHIIRGEDHISNTPRQILILEALGVERPFYAHIPMILAPDRSKMSKRYGTVSITEYQKQGFLPEAILNYLALLGWNPGGEKEVFKTEELIDLFDINRVQKGGAIFSTEKLRWFNSEHIKLLSKEERDTKLMNFLKSRKNDLPEGLYELIQESESLREAICERTEVFEDVIGLASEGEYDYLLSSPEIDPEKINWKDTPSEQTRSHLDKLIDLLESLDSYEKPEFIKNAVWEYATEKGRGEVLWPMRVALSGKEQSLDPFTIASVLGKLKTVERLKKAKKNI
ncbi:MAG: glutamate--tRNA ligase [Candidatus Campbellbacteria bacterium]|nr:glutamate--tRNA ligase [Candidatus Campbellbacteria bacterium]